ncbi:MAG: ABC transporter permease [Chloroflexales bacterium]|nr:ABC transporter permease [Chloroflexales bacterium]
MNVRRIGALAQAKVWSFINWRRSSYISLIESALYLALFGAGLSGVVGAQTIGNQSLSYLEFLFVGLIAVQSFRVFPYMTFTCSNDVKWGMYRLYVLAGTTPLEYLLARGLNAWLYMLMQWIILYIAAILTIGGSILFPGMVMAVLSIPGVLFWACLGAVIGTLIQDYGTRDLVGTAVILPVVFSSTALYSLDNAPAFLRVLSRLNPLTYQADSLRLAYIGDWNGALIHSGLLLIGVVALAIVAQYVLPHANLASMQRA